MNAYFNKKIEYTLIWTHTLIRKNEYTLIEYGRTLVFRVCPYTEDYFNVYLIEYVFSQIIFSRTKIGTFVENFFWQSISTYAMQNILVYEYENHTCLYGVWVHTCLLWVWIHTCGQRTTWVWIYANEYKNMTLHHSKLARPVNELHKYIQ